MARFEDFEDSGLRIKYDDAGLPVDVLDARGNSFGFALLKKNLTGGIDLIYANESQNPMLGAASPHPAASASAEQISACIQAALAKNGVARINAPGVYNIDRPVLVGTGQTLSLGDGVSLVTTGAQMHCAVRLGNAEVMPTSDLINGFAVLCADTSATEGMGALALVRASGAWSVKWKATGDSAYGSPVSITASGKVAVPSGNGSSIYLRIYFGFLPAVNGTYTHDVYVTKTRGAQPITWSRTASVMTVTEAGHGRRVNDVVEIYGAAAGVFAIQSVTSDTYKVNDSRGAGSGSGRAYSVDNSSVTQGHGGQINAGNGAEKNSTQNTGLIAYMHNNSLISGAYKQTAGKYSIFSVGCGRARFERLSFPGTDSDALNICGPVYNTVVDGIVGTAGDNLLGIGTSNSDDYCLVDGVAETATVDIDSLTVNDPVALDNVVDAIRLFGGPGRYRYVAINRPSGSVLPGNPAFIWAFADAMILNGSACLIDKLVINEPRIKNNDGTAYAHVLFDAGCNVESAEIRSARYRNDNAGVGSLVNALARLSGGSIKHLLIDAPRAEDVSLSGQKSRVFYWHGGTVGEVEIRSQNSNNLAAVVGSNTGLTQGGHYKLSGITNGVPFPVIMGSLFSSIDFSGLNAQSATALYSTSVTAAGTVKIRGTGLAGNAMLYLPASGSTVFDVNSPEMLCDLSRCSRTAGNMARSSGQGTIPGNTLAVCDNSNAAGSWKAVHNPALTY